MSDALRREIEILTEQITLRNERIHHLENELAQGHAVLDRLLPGKKGSISQRLLSYLAAKK